MITTKQRASLRALANQLEPVAMIERAKRQKKWQSLLNKCLKKRIIKVKIQENACLDTKETAQRIAAVLNADIVQCIGFKFVYTENQKIILRI